MKRVLRDPLPIKNIKNRGKLILFNQLSSILFVGYFVTAPFLFLYEQIDLLGPYNRCVTIRLQSEVN